MSNKLLLISRHIMTTGLKNAFKVGSVKFANLLSPLSSVNKIHIGSKKQPRDLSDAGQKSRELTTSPKVPDRLNSHKCGFDQGC